MKSSLPILALAVAGCSSQPGPINRNSIDENLNSGFVRIPRPTAEMRDTQRAFDTEKKADISVEYTADLKMDINVGPLTKYGDMVARDPRLFAPEELIPFFDDQKRKKLVVVMFHKNTWSDDKEKMQIERINAYFRDRGYRRIVIQQFRSWGRPTLSDIRA